MNLNAKQSKVKEDIEQFSFLFDIDPKWAIAIAMTESSLGLHQKSPTGCRGVFQMSQIAMKDLLISMEELDDDLVDIACGIAFLKLLKKRWKSEDEATRHFCDPKDLPKYLDKVHEYMKCESP